MKKNVSKMKVWISNMHFLSFYIFIGQLYMPVRYAVFLLTVSSDNDIKVYYDNRITMDQHFLIIL